MQAKRALRAAQHMSQTYGGAQPVMRNTIIREEEGYVGTHFPRLLNVGDTQLMIFLSQESGPWYLSSQQREAQRKDQATGKSRRIERSKKLLVKAMSEAGVDITEKRGYTRKELQTFARLNGVDTFEEKQGVIGGWEGKPKSLLQALWERGLILEELLDKYTLDGRKDAMTGKIDLKLSLCHLMAENMDFKNEETALQYLGTQLGVTVELTLKISRRACSQRHRIQLGSCEGVFPTSSSVLKAGAREF